MQTVERPLYRWDCGKVWDSSGEACVDSESNSLSSRLSVSIFLINCFGNFNKCFTPFLLKFSWKILPMQWVSSYSAPRNKSSILSASMWWCLKSIFQVISVTMRNTIAQHKTFKKSNSTKLSTKLNVRWPQQFTIDIIVLCFKQPVQSIEGDLMNNTSWVISALIEYRPIELPYST